MVSNVGIAAGTFAYWVSTRCERQVGLQQASGGSQTSHDNDEHNAQPARSVNGAGPRVLAGRVGDVGKAPAPLLRPCCYHVGQLRPSESFEAPDFRILIDRC